MSDPNSEDSKRATPSLVVDALFPVAVDTLYSYRVPRDLALALATFALLFVWRFPAWLIVLLAALAGQMWLKG